MRECGGEVTARTRQVKIVLNIDDMTTHGGERNHDLVRNGRDETVVTIGMQRIKYARERDDATGARENVEMPTTQ